MNRLSCLIRLLGWLERAGHRRVLIVDNASNYLPLMDYYETVKVSVLRLRKMHHPRTIPFHPSVKRFIGDSYFVLTDPDILPVKSCPHDAVRHFREVLDRYPELQKVGYGLKIDDLPKQYRHREDVQAWESQFWTAPIESNLYRAPIDTTFALYRAHPPSFRYTFMRSARTGAPYLARHLPWYMDSAHPSEEERHYRKSLDANISNWNRLHLPKFITNFTRRKREESA